MTHCDNCYIAWDERDYKECPLCKAKEEFGAAEDEICNLREEISNLQEEIDDLNSLDGE